ncbi:uncharacterized protein LOC118330706 [Morone saxatilis]|uniref:uncharacterized protein LOC118330706 n=1 Tax=Morone saxatilis TaxID=34816 RepID=UPI0015E23F58|nr:uncharacterized protein LOC118330706 [Morone saxatilis]
MNLKQILIRKKTSGELRNTSVLIRSLNRKQSFCGDEGLYRTTIGESTVSLNRNKELKCPASSTSSTSSRKCFHGNNNNNSSILTRKQFRRKDSDSSDSSSDASFHSSDSEYERWKHEWNNQRQEEQKTNPLQAYWPVVPPTVTDSEGGGGGDEEEVKLQVENKVNNQSAAEDGALPSSPDSNQQPMRRRGILKTRIPPLPRPPLPPPPAVMDRNRKYLLSEAPPLLFKAPSTPTNRSLDRQVTGGNSHPISSPDAADTPTRVTMATAQWSHYGNQNKANDCGWR